MVVANITEARTHNVPPEIFLQHFRAMRDAAREHEDTGMALARTKKAAKTAGIDLDAVKMLQKFGKLDDDVVEAQLRHAREYAIWLEMPIGTQLGMFAKPDERIQEVTHSTKETQKTWEAGERGLLAGRAGDANDNPYPAGSPGHVAWAKKYSEGLTERATAARMESTESERPADVAPATKRGGAGKPAGARKPRAPTAAEALKKARNHLGGDQSRPN